MTTSIIKEDYLDDVDASVDHDGVAIDISGQLVISIQFVWTSGVEGTIDFELSNDGKSWSSVVMEATGPDGGAGSEVLELKSASRYVRGVFKAASGSSGTLKAHLISKGEG